MTRKQAVAIVGAGPAGIAAALALAEYGVPAILIDEAEHVGGQYYKHFGVAPGSSRGRELDQLRQQGRERHHALERSKVDVRLGTTVWGFFEPNRMALVADDRVEVIEAASVLIATGAIERVAAFPGWTLPGVMTAGAAQRVLSHDGILPGRRFVLAGTGPLLLAIATQIVEAGGEVAAVVDCVGLTEPTHRLRHAQAVVGQPRRLRQWADYRLALRRAGVPYFHNYTVVEARGDGELREVVIAEKDAGWNIVPETRQVLEADTLCLHFGFAASTELAQLAGCALAFARERGGWYVAHDDGMRASRPGFYVAGQVSGIGGADLAEATGALAGLTIAYDLGVIGAEAYDRAARPLRRTIRQGRAFARMLNEVYTEPPGIARLVEPTTVLCRCEEVTASQIDQAVAAGVTTLNGLKRRTRCGMGFCQGRICSQVVGRYLEGRYGVAPDEAGVFNARVPLKPVPLGALATIPDDAS